MKITRYQKAILVAVALVSLVAVFDFFEYPASFWLYSFALGAVAATVYYIFVGDKSEAIAMFAGFYIMMMFGLEDFTFFLIRPIFQDYAFGIPPVIENLSGHAVIGRVAEFMGSATVTPKVLIVSVLIGGVITYYVTKWLKQM